jgi:hypothetical protein
MQISSIELFELLKPKLGEREARVLVQFVEAKTEDSINSKKYIFLTKEDKIEIIEKLERNRTEVIKWMFIFWIGQLAAIVAILNLFFKH